MGFASARVMFSCAVTDDRSRSTRIFTRAVSHRKFERTYYALAVMPSRVRRRRQRGFDRAHPMVAKALVARLERDDFDAPCDAVACCVACARKLLFLNASTDACFVLFLFLRRPSSR